MTEATPHATEIAARRKHTAKRLNEHLKLSAAYVNAMAIAVAGAAIIVPMVSSPDAMLDRSRVSWLVGSLALRCAAHVVIRFLRREE